ncbi:methyltransferase domain-containing protein [Candidatus Micrarchaeota archaeon]|nr:methyltransferase domain-containing protein [Candidatus Micrarchaeota archaeon]
MPQCYRLVEGTIEIDGVRMHQTKNKAPVRDAEDKVSELNPRPGAKALDVCTGLGYSAVALAKRECSVVTIEKDANVLECARQNKDSKELFGNPKIELVVEDAFLFLPSLPSGHFDLVLHDPPRLSMAGELYSEVFYRELFRVLKKGGKLFHYAGAPGKLRGKNIPRGVKERLQRAGFAGLRFVEHLQGFVGLKA